MPQSKLTDFRVFLSAQINFLSQLFNPKQTFESDQRINCNFILECIKTSFDIGKIITITLALFSIAITALILTITGIIPCISYLNRFLHQLPSTINIIEWQNKIWLIIAIIAFLVLLTVQLFSICLNYFSLSSYQIIKNCRRPFWINIKKSWEKRELILSPVAFMIALVILFELMVVGNGYIFIIPLLGGLLFIPGYFLTILIGLCLALLILIYLSSIVYPSCSYFENEKQQPMQAFYNSMDLFAKNFSGFLWGIILIIVSAAIYFTIIWLLYGSVAGSIYYGSHKLLFSILKEKLTQLLTIRQSSVASTITLAATSSSLLTNLFFACAAIAFPIAYLVNGLTLLYYRISSTQTVPDIPTAATKYPTLSRRGKFLLITYVGLVIVGILFSTTFFDKIYANFQYNSGKYFDAMECYERILKKEPKYDRGYLQIAKCMEHTSFNQQAVTDHIVHAIELNKNLAKDPEVYSILVKYGDMLFFIRRYFPISDEGDSYTSARDYYQLILDLMPKLDRKKADYCKEKLSHIALIERKYNANSFENVAIFFSDVPGQHGKLILKDTRFFIFQNQLYLSIEGTNNLYNLMDKTCRLKLIWYCYDQPEQKNEIDVNLLLDWQQKKFVHIEPINVSQTWNLQAREYFFGLYDSNNKLLCNKVIRFTDQLGIADTIRLFYYLSNEKSKTYSGDYFVKQFLENSSGYDEWVNNIEYCYLYKVGYASFINANEAVVTGEVVIKHYNTDTPKKIRMQFGVYKKFANCWAIKWSKRLD